MKEMAHTSVLTDDLAQAAVQCAHTRTTRRLQLFQQMYTRRSVHFYGEIDTHGGTQPQYLANML